MPAANKTASMLTCGQFVEHHHLKPRILAPLEQEQGALDVLARLQVIWLSASAFLSKLHGTHPLLRRHMHVVKTHMPSRGQHLQRDSIKIVF